MHLISFCLRPRLTAVLAVLSVSAATFAGALEDALRLVPADAAGALVIPSVKGASDDLQLAIDRMGKAEAALGGRPIDLLKAQLGIGAGFDDRGACVAWAAPRATGFTNIAAFPVTDADAFVAATLLTPPNLEPVRCARALRHARCGFERLQATSW